MKKLMVVLIAAACASASFAETQWLDWFKLDKTNAETASWIGDGDVTVEGDKFVIDTDTTVGLTHTPAAATSVEAGRQFTFAFSVEAPCDLAKLTIPEDTKGGVTIAKNANEELAFFVIGSESDQLAWLEFADAGTPALDTDCTVTLTVDGTAVTYAIGGQTMVCTLPSEVTEPKSFTVLGTGSFAEINGKQAQTVVASITKGDPETTICYATFAEAYAAAEDGDTIKLLENVTSAVAPARKTVTIDANGKALTLETSVDDDKVLRSVYANGQIVTQLDFDKDSDGAYQIADENALRKLAKAVAAGSVGKDTFKQTADIALTETFPGIGFTTVASKQYNDKGAYVDCSASAKDCVSFTIGTKKENVQAVDGTNRWEHFKANAFAGTYDGNGKKITAVKIPGGDYTGFFNCAYKATIKNLSLGTADKGIVDQEGGCTAGLFVGVARECELSGLTALAGDLTAGKDAAAFVAYMSGGSLVNCTNDMNVTFGNTAASRKGAGLVSIAQWGNTLDGAAGTATIEGCVNNGNVTAVLDPQNGCAAILGYCGMTTVIRNCEAYGTVTTNESSAKTLYASMVGHVNKGNLSGEGNKTTLTAIQSIAQNDADGFMFARIENDVATFVNNSEAVSGANLKVMRTGATVTLANVGDRITLDESLATATVATTAANAYVDKDGNTYTVTAKTDYSEAAIVPFADAEWTETLDFPTVVVKVGDVTVPTEAYTFAWVPAEIAAMKAGDPDATYTCTVTIKDTGKVILPATAPTAVWTVKAPAAPAGVTITVVRSTGIADVQKDNVSIFEDAETAKTLVLETGATSVSLTLVADSSIAIPVYKMSKAEIGAGPASKSGSYAIADGDTLTFTALEADVGGVTDAEAQAAIKEVVTSDAAKAKVDAVVEAGVNAKTLATWVGKQTDKTAALEGGYVKASVELDVDPITEGTEVKLVDVDMADVSATTFKVEVGTDDVSAKEAVLSMVKAGTDVEFKTTFNPSATIVGEEGEKTVQVDISGKDAAFLKVEIPADAK